MYLYYNPNAPDTNCKSMFLNKQGQKVVHKNVS